MLVLYHDNTRHENLVFFCGYVIDRERLGIVMELVRGRPLSAILHDDDAERTLDINEMVDFAKQICQVSHLCRIYKVLLIRFKGVSYLHTKRILHKDLRSKNVLIKDRKVVITDFGLFSAKRLAYPYRSVNFLYIKGRENIIEFLGGTHSSYHKTGSVILHQSLYGH